MFEANKIYNIFNQIISISIGLGGNILILILLIFIATAKHRYNILRRNVHTEQKNE